MKANSLLAEVRGAVDAYIAECLGERVRQAATIHPRYERLWREIARVYQAGGKRMRPYLTVVGYGKIDEAIVSVVAAGGLYIINLLPFVRICDDTSAMARAGWRRFLWLNYVVGAVVTMVLLLGVWGA
ncbi:MAG: hypothetical protein Q4B05_04145 [Candidatus Saccharibacteria bacterium]|nr:hypothetical protein [Candidatus Saccharibacteria bacterium]